MENDEGNVVMFGHPTRLDIPPERVLNAATAANLSEVVILGRDQDGDEYFASSIADGGDVVWLMERLKAKLINGDYE